MNHLRPLLLTACLASLVIPAAAGDEPPTSCRPPGYDRETLLALRAEGFEIADPAARERFVFALVDCLGDPDPALRDGVAYEGFATLLRGKQLSADAVRRLRSALLEVLGSSTADPSGVRRPFAALVLSEVARADRLEAVFSEPERRELVSRAAAYVREVEDYRGFDAETGWRHGVAHGADILMQLALNPQLEKAQLIEIRDAVAAQIAPTGEHFYIYGEPARLARPIHFLAQRGLFTDVEWAEWFKVLSAPAPLEDWSAAFASQTGLARLHNLKAFAQAVYVNASASEEAAAAPLEKGALDLLGALP